MRQDSARIPIPAPRTGIRPTRSTAIPTNGENAYIPGTCTDRTRPMTVTDIPSAFMCTGVMDMMETMTVCDTATTAMANTARGAAAMIANDCRSDIFLGA